MSIIKEKQLTAQKISGLITLEDEIGWHLE